MESLEPEPAQRFLLERRRARSGGAARKNLERLLRQHRAVFELRALSGEEISYEVRLPFDNGTEELSTAIMSFGEPGKIAVEWEEKKSGMNLLVLPDDGLDAVLGTRSHRVDRCGSRRRCSWNHPEAGREQEAGREAVALDHNFGSGFALLPR